MDESIKPVQRKTAQRNLRQEQQKSDNRHIKQVLGKMRAGAVSKVEVQNEDGTYTRVKIQTEVEAALMQNNEKRFRLTETTPFMQEPMQSVVRFLGATDAVKGVIAGTYVCPEGTNEFTHQFVQALKEAALTKGTINTEMTREDFQLYLRKVKEKTSSVFSGVHFGH